MTTRDEGGTRFLDGMRVTREHLEHLRDSLLGGVVGLRETIGLGRVAYGFKVEIADPGTLLVSPGLAIDAHGRPLLLEEERSLTLEFGEASSLYLTAKHVLRAEGMVDGIPTLLFNDLTLETQTSPPPYEDGSVVFAGVRLHEGGPTPFQKGEWYLPPLNHHHTGGFVEDAGRWRFDGHALGGSVEPLFDSGFLPVDPGESVTLIHGLKSLDLFVQLQSRVGEVVTTRGYGESFYYELPDPQEIRLVRAEGFEGELELRAVVWPLGDSSGAPFLPLADAGVEEIVEFGVSFTLDGSRSRAFGNRKLTSYVWTQLS
jgi:hypothetical protein